MRVDIDAPRGFRRRECGSGRSSRNSSRREDAPAGFIVDPHGLTCSMTPLVYAVVILLDGELDDALLLVRDLLVLQAA